MIGRLLCWFGLHSWMHLSARMRACRQRHCDRVQFLHFYSNHTHEWEDEL